MSILSTLGAMPFCQLAVSSTQKTGDKLDWENLEKVGSITTRGRKAERSFARITTLS
jgi:hypothetical protein